MRGIFFKKLPDIHKSLISKSDIQSLTGLFRVGKIIQRRQASAPFNPLRDCYWWGEVFYRHSIPNGIVSSKESWFLSRYSGNLVQTIAWMPYQKSVCFGWSSYHLILRGIIWVTEHNSAKHWINAKSKSVCFAWCFYHLLLRGIIWVTEHNPAKDCINAKSKMRLHRMLFLSSNITRNHMGYRTQSR